MKQAMELNEFDIIFKMKANVKGQVLADFGGRVHPYSKNGIGDGTRRSFHMEPIC